MNYIKIENYSRSHYRSILAFGLTAAAVLTSLLFFKTSTSLNYSFGTSSQNVGNASESFQNIPKVKVGPKTNALILDLENIGLDPISVSNITRDFFSAEGKMITLDGDNIQVFEYADSLAATGELFLFQKSAQTRRGSWKKNVHLYANVNLIIFYMGERKNIIDSLNSIFGKPIML